MAASSANSSSKNSVHGIIIALAILNAVGLLGMFFKLDMLHADIKSGMNAMQTQRKEMDTPTTLPPAQNRKSLEEIFGTPAPTEITIPSMEEAHVTAKNIDGNTDTPFTLKQGEAADINTTNSGGDVGLKVTVASLNEKGAILGLQSEDWPVKIVQIMPTTKTVTYGSFTLDIQSLTANSLTLTSSFEQN